MLGVEEKNCCITGLKAVQPKSKFWGRVFTGLIERVNIQRETWCYEDMLEKERKYYSGYDMADACPAGDVLVLGGAEGTPITGLLAYRAILNKGVAAYVLDGGTRDFEDIAEYPMPLFCSGATLLKQDPNIKETGFGVPIQCNGVPVDTGDYIVGDGDGIVVIPRRYIEPTLELAQSLLEVEKKTLEALDKMLPPLEVKKISGSRAELLERAKTLKHALENN